MTDLSPPTDPADRPAAPTKEPVWHGFPTGFATLRDIICFLFGSAIIIHEVFLSPSVETTSVGVGIALCGLPLVLGADDRKKG